MAVDGLRHPARRWWWLGGVAGLLLASFLVAANVTGDGSGAPAGYPTRTVTVGAVSVSLQLVRIDPTSATISVSFDTHSGALDLDVARHARLVVAGNIWQSATWRGDGPGGHHRHGQLQFSGAGAATGTVTVTLTGLSKPVTASWQATP